jgi:hypothetical protein
LLAWQRFWLVALILPAQVDTSLVPAKIRPALAKMEQDPDRDVKFYAQQALASCA